MNKIEHLLTCLVEECSEVQKEATKALRFGLDDKWKNNPDQAEKIIVEVCDLVAVLEMLIDEGALPVLGIEDKLIKKKKEKVLEYMQYAVKRKTLTLP